MGVHCDRKRDENNERNKSIRREGSYALYMLSGKSAKKNRNVVKEGEIACFYRREEPRGKNRIGRETKRQRERERCRNSFYEISINKEDSSRLGSLIYYLAWDRSSLGNGENRSIRARTIGRRKEKNGKNGVISRLI